MYTVYILYSLSSGKYYVGQTSDIENRLRSHNYSSERSYTSKYRPWQLYWRIEVATRSQAMRLESYLKKKPRGFLKRLLTDKALADYIIGRFSSAG